MAQDDSLTINAITNIANSEQVKAKFANDTIIANLRTINTNDAARILYSYLLFEEELIKDNNGKQSDNSTTKKSI